MADAIVFYTVVGIAIAMLSWCLVPCRPVWGIRLIKKCHLRTWPFEPMLLRMASNRQLWLISLAVAGLCLPISLICDCGGVTSLKLETGFATRWARRAATFVFIATSAKAAVHGNIAGDQIAADGENCLIACLVRPLAKEFWLV